MPFRTASRVCKAALSKAPSPSRRRGLSSPRMNITWSVINLVVGWMLLPSGLGFGWQMAAEPAALN